MPVLRVVSLVNLNSLVPVIDECSAHVALQYDVGIEQATT
jgi:hypothetical protein